jgi:hypothetical protein
VDLLEVSKDAPEQARLTTTDAPTEGLLLDVRRDVHTITVLIAGTNMKSRRKTVQVRHDGKWDGGSETLGIPEHGNDAKYHLNSWMTQD